MGQGGAGGLTCRILQRSDRQSMSSHGWYMPSVTQFSRMTSMLTHSNHVHRVKDKSVGTMAMGPSAPWNVMPTPHSPPPPPRHRHTPHSCSSPPLFLPCPSSQKTLEPASPLTTDMATRAKPTREPKPRRAAPPGPPPTPLPQPESSSCRKEEAPRLGWQPSLNYPGISSSDRLRLTVTASLPPPPPPGHLSPPLTHTPSTSAQGLIGSLQRPVQCG